ncbi:MULTISPECIES: trans-acting enoyl reductase family protein [unclassified Polaromonas]|uniref:saccharopine dehydrogenase family protein n=1 Tax=unclassified Polaromonas TaxID=2638319 RepID=UPI000F097C47|nr:MULTISPECIES: saccharopine dehydrogenase NADP-binding domain-containing protein [unclassified Polaromonas]AYQ29961.1 saccharopine dehydrogenase [Polaromonas sp. SP1]QGJ18923.1 NAD(P)H-binding protein [Polaromonas sp. Pch-P]
MHSNPTIAVYGAYGHTGRFVVAELLRRGLTPVLSGRDAGKLAAFGMAHPGLAIRAAAIDDPAALDHALQGAAAVINCAGPFASTAAPVIDAALRARIPYLDVAAEIEANVDTFAHYADRARDAGILVVPAMAFYGGLSDLLATVAMGDWTAADEISVAYALSSWAPTAGTRAAGQVSRQRRGGRRLVFTEGQLAYRTEAAPPGEWAFPAPVGTQPVVTEFTMADSVTIPRHVKVPEIRTYMAAAAVKDLVNPDLAPPPAIDESGRSSQTFLVEVVVRSAGRERRAVASGRDIYAITAPLVVEAAVRAVDGRARATGVRAAGETFDSRDFLQSLAPQHLALALHAL